MALDYGIKVVEDGYDVATAALENISFSSAHTFFKIHSDSSSNLTVPASSTGEIITFSHTLGYVPAFLMYSTLFTGDSYDRPIPRGKSPDPIFANAYGTSSNVVFKITLDGAQIQFSITVRCIIFKDKVS